jgi:hypothetical protein
MRAFQHLARLLRELGILARRHKAWWVVPLVVALLLVGVLIVVGQSTSPLVYTFF